MGGVKRKNSDNVGHENKRVKKAHIKEASTVKVDFRNSVFVISWTRSTTL